MKTFEGISMDAVIGLLMGFIVVVFGLLFEWLSDRSEFCRRLGHTATGWLGRHPVLAAFILVGILYIVTPTTLVFIGVLALVAIVEMSRLWAEVERQRRKLDELQSRTEGDHSLESLNRR